MTRPSRRASRRDAVTHVADSDDAADARAGRVVRDGDLVLVKGSHGTRDGARRGAAAGGVRLMLYHLLFPLHDTFSVLNVTRYITFRTAVATITALFISLFFGPWMIRRLREFQIGQVIRQEGPESHRAKAGTPTMGGLLILTAALVPTLLWADLTNPYIWIAVLVDRGVRRHRLRRRLPEGHAPVAPRPASPLQDGAAGRSSPWRSASSLLVLATVQPLQHAPDLPVLQAR